MTGHCRGTPHVRPLDVPGSCAMSACRGRLWQQGRCYTAGCLQRVAASDEPHAPCSRTAAAGPWQRCTAYRMAGVQASDAGHLRMAAAHSTCACQRRMAAVQSSRTWQLCMAVAHGSGAWQRAWQPRHAAACQTSSDACSMSGVERCVQHVRRRAMRAACQTSSDVCASTTSQPSTFVTATSTAAQTLCCRVELPCRHHSEQCMWGRKTCAWLCVEPACRCCVQGASAAAAQPEAAPASRGGRQGAAAACAAQGGYVEPRHCRQRQRLCV
eukprot:156030-Chlamydomonas_euryale.AAC.2